jgi:hypothetical protein
MMADNPKKKRDRRPIVYGTDFSATSTGAVDIAAAMARQLGINLVLVHVDEFYGMAPVDPTLFEPALTHRRGELNRVAERLRELGTDVDEKLVSGSAFDELLNATIQSKARLSSCPIFLIPTTKRSLPRKQERPAVLRFKREGKRPR